MEIEEVNVNVDGSGDNKPSEGDGEAPTDSKKEEADGEVKEVKEVNKETKKAPAKKAAPKKKAKGSDDESDDFQGILPPVGFPPSLMVIFRFRR
jgi:hypothetical protein